MSEPRTSRDELANSLLGLKFRAEPHPPLPSSKDMTQPLRGALLGFGFIGSKGHLEGYRAMAQRGEDVRIEAVADLSEARRRAAKEALPQARIYSDPLTLLDAEAARLDFVDIATPPHLHAPLARKALEQGLHVLCEKPLATTYEDALTMLSTAQRARRVLFPAHNYKHAPVVKAIREELDRGRIGEVRLVTLSTFRTTHAKGTPEWRPDWRREASYSGGGIAMDHGSHTFYLAFDWLGGYPTAVSAKMSTLGSFDTEDNFSCALTFPKATVSAHLSWTAGAREVIYTIHGARGAITVDDDHFRVSFLDENGARQIEERFIASDWMDASHAKWFGSLFAQFRGSIDRSEYVSSDAIDALQCIQLITKAYASARRSCIELPLEPTPSLSRLPREDRRTTTRIDSIARL